MTIVIEDSQIERLVESIADAYGISINEVLRKSLLPLAGTPHAPTPTKAPLRERLAKLAQEVDAIPSRTPLDTRSDDEVLGYNEYGGLIPAEEGKHSDAAVAVDKMQAFTQTRKPMSNVNIKALIDEGRD